MQAATYTARWPIAPRDQFRVALYRGDYTASTIVYHRAAFSDHRTLKAACRRLAHLIHQQGRTGYTGERYDRMYIVTPDGERLPLRAAQARL